MAFLDPLARIQNRDLEAALKRARREPSEASQAALEQALRRAEVILALLPSGPAGQHAAKPGEAFQVLRTDLPEARGLWAAFTNKELFLSYGCSGFLQINGAKLLELARKQKSPGVILNPAGPDRGVWLFS